MNLKFNETLAKGYKSKSQIARVLSEDWVKNYAFCPNCLSRLDKFANNAKSKDFFCKNCDEIFELKSKSKNFGKKILDGEYNTMMKSLKSNQKLNFLFLRYECLHVKDFLVVPRYFLTPNLIEQRKPLSQNAKRAKYIGCNILFDKIASEGKIFIIKNEVILQKTSIVNKFQNIKKLKTQNMQKRMWLMEILRILETLENTFLLEDVYKYEEILANIFTRNHFIKEKIRQSLQYLRDYGFIKFLGNGKYEKIHTQ